ncbi:MAG TPA: hybrid sensor histidine kinase/response regulator [Oligoflexia bacterium]|nr:hybrid sensor histidine kinase/response regulator [Oligoflexia bacterium]HMP26988.1 hybrid sensor histidine kinase/response regulator [Oligoflexia bacterium]
MKVVFFSIGLLVVLVLFFDPLTSALAALIMIPLVAKLLEIFSDIKSTEGLFKAILDDDVSKVFHKLPRSSEFRGIFEYVRLIRSEFRWSKERSLTVNDLIGDKKEARSLDSPFKDWVQDRLSDIISEVGAEQAVFVECLGGENLVNRQRFMPFKQCGPRLLKQLELFFFPYFNEGDLSIFGVYDGLKSLDQSFDFSMYGYRFFMALPLKLDSQQAALWFGFREGMRPGFEELKLVDNWRKNFSREYRIKKEHTAANHAIQKANRTVSIQRDLIAGLSHDLKSPLNNIKAISSYLKERAPVVDGAFVEMIENIERNCEGLGELIADIVDLYKYQNQQLKIRKENFDFLPLLREIKNNFEYTARRKGLNLFFEVSDCVHFSEVCADRRQLIRAISNILSNAIKYTEFGGCRVKAKSAKEEGFLEIAISDTGVGISAEDQRNLFKPFSRFDPEMAEGSGLGLTIAKVLIESNGGKITIFSERNSGTTVVIKFPLATRASKQPVSFTDRELNDDSVKVAANNIQNELEKIKSNPLFDLGSINLLVVDDDQDFTLTLVDALKQQGIRVNSAFTVSDALSVANFSPPTHLITDLNLPAGGPNRLYVELSRRGIDARILILTGEISETKLEATINSLPRQVKLMQKPADLRKILEWLSGGSSAIRDSSETLLGSIG